MWFLPSSVTYRKSRWWSHSSPQIQDLGLLQDTSISEWLGLHSRQNTGWLHRVLFFQAVAEMPPGWAAWVFHALPLLLFFVMLPYFDTQRFLLSPQGCSSPTDSNCHGAVHGHAPSTYNLCPDFLVLSCYSTLKPHVRHKDSWCQALSHTADPQSSQMGTSLAGQGRGRQGKGKG